jgi:hypothetical protein
VSFALVGRVSGLGARTTLVAADVGLRDIDRADRPAAC